jgi:hypothetical protein
MATDNEESKKAFIEFASNTVRSISMRNANIKVEELV